MAKDIDTSAVDKTLSDLRAALTTNVRGVRAGYLRNTVYTDDNGNPVLDSKGKKLTVADVALWNNFGTERIPARPFITDADRHAKQILPGKMQQYMELRMSVDDIAKLLALDIAEILRSEIDYGEFAPNAKITLEGGWMRSPNGKPFYVEPKKGKQPLVDTGQMKKSIRASIVWRDGETLVD